MISLWSEFLLRQGRLDLAINSSRRWGSLRVRTRNVPSGLDGTRTVISLPRIRTEVRRLRKSLKRPVNISRRIFFPRLRDVRDTPSHKPTTKHSPSHKHVTVNWYKDSSDWKPFHHDSAAFNERRAKTQNITVGVSFDPNASSRFECQERNANLFSSNQRYAVLFRTWREHQLETCHQRTSTERTWRKGRISIVLWGLCKNVIEEKGSPPLVRNSKNGGGRNRRRNKENGKHKKDRRQQDRRDDNERRRRSYRSRSRDRNRRSRSRNRDRRRFRSRDRSRSRDRRRR